MTLAYAVVLVDSGLYDHDTRGAVQMALAEADKKFEGLAQESYKTLVTRNPEARVMTVPELEQWLPGADVRFLVGLYFEADIS